MVSLRYLASAVAVAGSLASAGLPPQYAPPSNASPGLATFAIFQAFSREFETLNLLSFELFQPSPNATAVKGLVEEWQKATDAALTELPSPPPFSEVEAYAILGAYFDFEIQYRNLLLAVKAGVKALQPYKNELKRILEADIQSADRNDAAFSGALSQPFFDTAIRISESIRATAKEVLPLFG